MGPTITLSGCQLRKQCYWRLYWTSQMTQSVVSLCVLSFSLCEHVLVRWQWITSYTTRRPLVQSPHMPWQFSFYETVTSYRQAWLTPGSSGRAHRVTSSQWTANKHGCKTAASLYCQGFRQLHEHVGRSIFFTHNSCSWAVCDVVYAPRGHVCVSIATITTRLLCRCQYAVGQTFWYLSSHSSYKDIFGSLTWQSANSMSYWNSTTRIKEDSTKNKCAFYRKCLLLSYPCFCHVVQQVCSVHWVVNEAFPFWYGDNTV